MTLLNVFPVQHLLHKSQVQSKDYLYLILDYGWSLESSSHILTSSQLQIVSSKMDLFSKYRFQFYPEYGSAVIFERRQEFMPSNLGILFFNKMSVSAFTRENQSFQILQACEDVGYYELDHLEITGEDIDSEMESITEKITSALGQLSSKQKKEKSPFFFKKIVEYAMSPQAQKQQPLFQNSGPGLFVGQGQGLSGGHGLFGGNVNQQPKKQQKQQQIPVQIENQNTINFEHLIFPSIHHQFSYLVCSHVMADPKVVTVFLLSFKLHQLAAEVERCVNVVQEKRQISLFKECLKSLIADYKKLYNKEIEHDKESAFKKLVQINKKIDAMFYPEQQENALISTMDLSNSLREQKQFEVPQSIDTLIDYCSYTPSRLYKSSDIGFTVNLYYNSFQQLEHLYTSLYNKQNGQFYWVFAVEQCLFNIMDEFQQLYKEQISSASRSEIPTLQKVVNRYQAIMTDPEKNQNYSFKIKNQAYSHVYLVKYIAAALAFESLKVHYQNVFDFDDYTIRLQIQHLYNNFTSLNFRARNSFENLICYLESNYSKKVIFDLDQNSKGSIELKQFAKKMVSSNATLANCLASKEKALQSSVDAQGRDIESYRKRYNEVVNRKNQLSMQACSCSKSIYSYGYSQTCNRCNELRNAQSRLNNILSETFYGIVADLPEKRQDRQLLILIENLDPIVRGVMKIVYQAQVPIVKKESFSYQSKNALSTMEPLYPYTEKKKATKFNYSTYLHGSKPPIAYQAPLQLFCFNYNSHQYPDKMLLQPDILPEHKAFAWMINKYDQSNNSTREHMIYANLDKQKLLQAAEQISLEQFKEYGSIRVSFRTELIMLCQAILSRQASPNTHKTHQFQRRLLLNAAGSIRSFKILRKTKQNASKQMLQQEPKVIISESIEHLLTNFLHQWKFDDLYALGVTGVVFSLFSKLIGVPYLAMSIAKRAFEEYLQVKRQNKNKTNVVGQLRQLYLLHSIMACFSENICEDDGEACLVFAKIMANYRLVKRVLHSQSKVKSSFKNNVIYYQNYFNNSVSKNIDSVVQHFRQHPADMYEVVREIDEDVTKNYKWQLQKDVNYTFSGLGENKYRVNIFEGIILKNGCETSKLPDEIRSNPNFIEIFGKNIDLQVMQSKTGLIRTRSNFINYFQQEKDTQVFFQFCIDADEEMKIRMVFKKNEKERLYLFVPHQILEEQSIYIPELYMKHYQCWIDEEKKALIFRMRSLKKMSKVGLVLIRKEGFGSSIAANCLNQGRIITKQFQQESLDYLLDEEHGQYFQKLFLVDKASSQNKAIEILSSIEEPKYIIQIYSCGVNRKTVFWLHRCGLKFQHDQNQGLISQNFRGYSVASDYNHHQLLPWRRKDIVRCLILQKHQNSFRAASLHSFMMLLPNQFIKINGEVAILEGQTNMNEIINYDIHDNFMDIRSKNRVSQLHFACLIASLSSSMVFRPLMITNEEYCMDLVRSCYSNMPFNQIESSKVLNLISLAVELNLNKLLLCCEVMFKLGNSLAYVLAYPDSVFNEDDTVEISDYLYRKRDIVKTCKMIYRKHQQQGRLSPASTLTSMQLNILGIGIQKAARNLEQSKQCLWYKKESFLPKTDDKMIKNITNLYQSYQKTYKDIEHVKSNIMSFFDKQGKEVDLMQEFLLKVGLRDALAKEMNEDLDSSYKSYIRYNQQYERIQLKKEASIVSLIKFFNLPKQKCEKFKKDLLKQFQKIVDKNSQNLDVIEGAKPIISLKMVTHLLCSTDAIYEFYPKMSKQDGAFLLKVLRLWVLLTLQIESLSRIQLILSQRPIDKIALFRELQSPRKQINCKDYWICFEAEMKIRIWLSQYDTYRHLRDSVSGSVSQLNMGEGKTQVIIPMIVLQNIYSKDYSNLLSRINILSSLFQEAQANYFKFFSATSFRIPLMSLYFNRDVSLSTVNINLIKWMTFILRQKMVIMIDRESCLSVILKVREEFLGDGEVISELGEKRDDWMLKEHLVYDIFDEVDALMTCKKSFVYSVGSSEELPDARLRYELGRVLMEIVSVELFEWVIQSKFGVVEQAKERAIEAINQGGFPKGFKLKKDLKREQILQLRTKIVQVLLQQQEYCPAQFKFYDKLTRQQQKQLIKYLTDETIDNLKQLQHKLPKDINQILSVRGLVAFGILQHCLSMRNGVDFGVPGPQHPKKVGVPYEAGDVPSKRSQFSHPDVAILVSYISYFVKGLTEQQFSEALDFLMKKSNSVKRTNYGLWYNSIKDIDFRPADVSQFKQINLDSPAQIQYLYKKYRYNRNAIVYWLINRVFIQDLRQYLKSITSSCWDIAYVQKSIGFSGTKDTRWLFPNYLTWSPSQNDTINGTDGKMVHLMLNNTCGLFTVKEGKKALWERFCEYVLQIEDDDIGCIIDAGAILVGKSFEKQIVPWIVKSRFFNKNKFKGVTFCNQLGKWYVYNTVTLSVVERGTSIPEHETFVIFDEARTRGADIKMASNTKAVLSLAPNMTKDKLMQAVGRLRKFGRNQQIYIMATQQIMPRVKGLSSAVSLKDKVRAVIQWTCENSLEESRSLLYANSKLAQIHYKTILQKQPDIQKFDPALSSLYAGKITQRSVLQIYNISINSKMSSEQKSAGQIKELSARMQAYGSEHRIKSYDFDDVCEREVQFVVETEKIKENETASLHPQAQTETIDIYTGAKSTIDFNFDKKLCFSSNFIKCTSTQFTFFNSKSESQLCNINFFLWRESSLIVITQRQMHLELRTGTPCIGPFGIELAVDHKKFVGRFRDLTLEVPFVRNNGLERALIHAQFFNGNQIYDHSGRNMLFQLVKELISKSNRNSLQGQSLKGVPTETLVSHFLQRRRTFQSKFMSSDLEKIMIELNSIPKTELEA